MQHFTECVNLIEGRERYCFPQGQRSIGRGVPTREAPIPRKAEPSQVRMYLGMAFGSIIVIGGLLLLAGVFVFFYHSGPLDAGGPYLTELDRALNAAAGIILLVVGCLLLIGKYKMRSRARSEP